MTDYSYQSGSSGLMHHTSGGPEASRHWPWIGHPRDREGAFPVQPRFALADAAWAADLAAFEALANASEFERAMRFVKANGFRIATTDIPSGVRTAFIAWVASNWPSVDSDCRSGSGW